MLSLRKEGEKDVGQTGGVRQRWRDRECKGSSIKFFYQVVKSLTKSFVVSSFTRMKNDINLPRNMFTTTKNTFFKFFFIPKNYIFVCKKKCNADIQAKTFISKIVH